MSVDLSAFFGEAGVLGAVVDGKWQATHGDEFTVENPADRSVLARVADATAEDVDGAVASARHAYDSVWRGTRPAERGRILSRVAAAIWREAGEFARLETLDTGKPLRQARSDVETAARYFDFYAGAADKIYGETIPGDGDYWTYTLREPYGVVAHITPWNSPISQMCRGIAPCLAAGNTVVVKPSEITPLSSLAAAPAVRRGGSAAGRLQRDRRPGRHHGRGAGGPPGRGAHRLHRFRTDGAGDPARGGRAHRRSESRTRRKVADDHPARRGSRPRPCRPGRWPSCVTRASRASPPRG